MNLQIFLEEWKDTYKFGHKTVEVFVNPTKRELMDLGNIMRFFADNRTKKLYVWNGNTLHVNMMKKLNLMNGKDFYSIKGLNLMGGSAIKKDGKYILQAVDNIYVQGSKAIIKFLSKDWSWVEKYGIKVKNSPGIKELEDVLFRDRIVDKLRKSELKLPEEFNDAIKVGNRTIEIFTQPFKQKELESIQGKYKAVRFIADLNKKKIYAFPETFLHYLALPKKGYPWREKISGVIFGIADVNKNKLTTKEIDVSGYGFDIEKAKKMPEINKWLKITS